MMMLRRHRRRRRYPHRRSESVKTIPSHSLYISVLNMRMPVQMYKIR